MGTIIRLVLSLAGIIAINIAFAQEFESTVIAPGDNSITIEIFSKGTTVLWDYQLNANGIIATKHPVDGRLPITVFEKKFTTEESATVAEFINGIQADLLKEQYVNQSVQGELSFAFHFRYGSIRKKVVTSYEYPEELKKIVTFFNSYLHEKYKIVFE